MKTVLAGTEISTISVETLGVLHNQRPGRHLILVKLTGETPERTGVASGMSGSPVYIGGRLVGALSYAFPYAKEPIGGVTPIHEMFRLLEMEKRFGDRESGGFNGSNGGIMRFDMKAKRCLFKKPDFFNDNFLIRKSLLAVHGFSSVMTSHLGAWKEIHEFTSISGAAKSEAQRETGWQMKPGAAISAVLVDGDANISAAGTVTWTDGERMLAFGHSFFSGGQVELPFAECYIRAVLPSYRSSMKFADAGPPAGVIKQDRDSGAMGILGEEPSWYELHVETHFAQSSDLNRNYDFRIAKFPSMAPFLALSVLTDVLSSEVQNSGNFHTTAEITAEFPEEAEPIKATSFGGRTGGAFQNAFNILFPLINLHNAASGKLFPERLNISLNIHFDHGHYELTGLDMKRVRISRDEEKTSFVVRARRENGEMTSRRINMKIPADRCPEKVILKVCGFQEYRNWETRGRELSGQSLLDWFRMNVSDEEDVKNLYLLLISPGSGLSVNGRRYPQPPASFRSLIMNRNNIPPAGQFHGSLIHKERRIYDLPVFGSLETELTVDRRARQN